MIPNSQVLGTTIYQKHERMGKVASTAGQMILAEGRQVIVNGSLYTVLEKTGDRARILAEWIMMG
jgi:hypothetical protein